MTKACLSRRPRPWHRRALRTGMLPIIDNTKVVALLEASASNWW